jgi:predicted nucleic acid-binding protein
VAGVIVLDASVLIAYLDSEDAQHAKAEFLLVREIDDEFAANPLTLAEVLVGPSRAGRLGVAREALRELEVKEQPFPADSCVLLAAQHAAARVAAFDDRLTRSAEELGLVALRS